MFENAREFLARVIPWPEPGQPGYVNIHWTFPPPQPRPDGKPAWAGRACTSVSEAARSLEFALKPGSNTLDIYACMSSQALAEPKRTKGKGFQYNAPIRLAANAIALKSFWIDIDLKDTIKGYPTVEELFAALQGFINFTGLPKPTMIVATGGGYHVYWCVDRALTPAEWTPHAFALANAIRAFGLRCDAQCTIDAARVLRIPDTFNRKLATPRPVRFVGARVVHDYSYGVIASILHRFETAIPSSAMAAAAGGVDPSIFPRRPADTSASELGANCDAQFPPVDLDLVAQSCGFVAASLATGGAGNDNPLWNLTTLLSTFTKGGRADAHRMGNKHASYTPVETDAFFDRKDRERIQRGLGWPSCATIAATGAKACSSCALAAQGKSPLSFEQRPAPAVAQPAPVAAGATPPNGVSTIQTALGPISPAAAVQTHAPHQFIGASDLPIGYVRDTNNVISKVMVDPQNPGMNITVPISDYPIMNAWVQKDPYMLHFDSVVERNRVTQIDLLLENVATHEMRKALQAQGFMLAATDKHAGEFFVAWIKKLQQIKDSVASAPFGWQTKDGQVEGFIYGGRIWTPSGDSPSASANPVLNQHYKPVGQESCWLDAVQLVTSQGRPDLEAIVASAFAGPLVMATGHNGMLMSAFSKESGIGKSTASKIAQAVWGDPVKARQSLSDTYNSVMNKLGQTRSLPLYWDELKSKEDTDKFVNITFQISEGREKSRLNSSAQLREPGHWQTLVVSTSNDSLIDHVTEKTQTTLAGMYRIFEFRVQPVAENAPGQISEAEATVRLSKLNNNYGTIGLRYAQWLGKNYPQIESDMLTLSKSLGSEVSALKEERFWTSLMSCIVLGARYANMLFGPTLFDEQSIKRFLIDTLADMRKQRGAQTVDLTNSVNVSTIMSAFLKDMQREGKVLVTNRIHVSAGKPPAPTSPNAVKVLKPSDTSRLNGIIVQIGQDDKLMRVSSSAFGEWLKKNGKSRHHLMEALQSSITMSSVVGFLGSGTGLSFAKEHLLQFDLSSSAELNFIDEVQ